MTHNENRLDFNILVSFSCQNKVTFGCMYGIHRKIIEQLLENEQARSTAEGMFHNFHTFEDVSTCIVVTYTPEGIICDVIQSYIYGRIK